MKRSSPSIRKVKLLEGSLLLFCLVMGLGLLPHREAPALTPLVVSQASALVKGLPGTNPQAEGKQAKLRLDLICGRCLTRSPFHSVALGLDRLVEAAVFLELSHAVLLETKEQNTCRYVDTSGNHVTIAIAGASGQAMILPRDDDVTEGLLGLPHDKRPGEALPQALNSPLPKVSGALDTFQNIENMQATKGSSNLLQRPLREIGRIVIFNASPDFRLEFRRDETAGGNGIVRLGRIFASRQTIHSVTTVGSPHTRFVLDSFRGDDFTPGGGLHVSDILGNDKGLGVALSQLGANAKIIVDGDMKATVLIVNDLDGILDVGNDCKGELQVGGNISRRALLRVGRHMRGNATIAQDLMGTVVIGGRCTGRWTVIGDLAPPAVFQASEEITNLWVVRSLHGRVAAGGALGCKASGSVGETADLRADTIKLSVGDSLFGKAQAVGEMYVDVGDSIGQAARLATSESLRVIYGGAIINGAALQGGMRFLHQRARIAQGGSIIRQPGQTITKPGHYRLADHLLYQNATGEALRINASNVILDLDGYGIVGTAGPSSQAVGIMVAEGQSNVVVRNGTIRGFRFGLVERGHGDGAIVENIRALNNWYFGLWVESAGCIVRNNLILDTGGCTSGPDYSRPTALRVQGAGARIENNIISGIVNTSPNTQEVIGIQLNSVPDGYLSGNRIVNRVRLPGSYAIWANAEEWPGMGGTNLHFKGEVYMHFMYGITLIDQPPDVEEMAAMDLGVPLTWCVGQGEDRKALCRPRLGHGSLVAYGEDRLPLPAGYWRTSDE